MTEFKEATYAKSTKKKAIVLEQLLSSNSGTMTEVDYKAPWKHVVLVSKDYFLDGRQDTLGGDLMYAFDEEGGFQCACYRGFWNDGVFISKDN